MKRFRRKPVPAEALGIDSLELGDPPRAAAWDLFIQNGVFIDVDYSLRKVVSCRDGTEVGESGLHVACPGFHVPVVLIGDAIVFDNEGRPIGPPGIC